MDLVKKIETLIPEGKMSQKEITDWYKKLKVEKTYDEAVEELRAMRDKMPSNYFTQIWKDAISMPSQFKKKK